MFSRSILQCCGWRVLFALITIAAWLPVMTAIAAPQQRRTRRAPTLSPAEARRIIATRSRLVVDALHRRDMRGLARFVHPTRGVGFSPHPGVYESDATFTRDELRAAWSDARPRVWGETEAGEISMTFQAYFAEYIYDRDYARLSRINYNRAVSHGTGRNTLREDHPRAILVEYHSPDSHPGGTDWKSLWLVFERMGSEWFLVRIAHDEWTT